MGERRGLAHRYLKFDFSGKRSMLIFPPLLCPPLRITTMPKSFSFLLLLTISLASTSCLLAPADVALTAELTQGEWALQAMRLDGQSTLESCDQDNVLVFFDNGEFARRWGSLRCDSSLEAVPQTGTWAWRRSEEDIRLRYRPRGVSGVAIASEHYQVQVQGDTLRLLQRWSEGSPEEELEERIYWRQ
jgi:hypothetical protein